MLPALAFLVLASLVPVTQQELPLERLDAAAEAALEEWKVPGLALAIVREGEGDLLRAWGSRDRESEAPVGPDTLFAIGSITKSFTAALVCLLAEEGHLELDAPLRSALPAFQLQDPVATQGMSPRDLLCHRSGLPRHDLLWYGSNLSRRELFQRLRDLPPSAAFRAKWQYQNLMYLTAGILVEEVTGQRWEEALQQRILQPLGMTRSNTSVEQSVQDPDFARPHAEVDGRLVSVPFRNVDEIGPAGSLNSSVREMTAWLRLHLGLMSGSEVLSEAVIREMATPQMVMPPGVMGSDAGPSSYGLGWVLGDHRGHRLVQHGGSIDGFVAQIGMLPDARAGWILLSNRGRPNPVPSMLSSLLADLLLELEPRDWAAEARAKQAEAAAEAQRRPARVEGTRPSHELAEYHGRFEHPAYGRAEITGATGQLVLDYRGHRAVLEHWHYDQFRIAETKGASDPYGGRWLRFDYDRGGRIDRLRISLEEAVDDLEFRRVGGVEAAEAGPVARLGALPISHRLPQGWSMQPVDSSMRAAEFAIEGSPLRCVVYFFGVGGGGGRQANIDRWLAQFETTEEPEVETAEPSPGVVVTTVRAQGRYLAAARSGEADPHRRDDWALRASIVDLEGGPLYVKVVGPKREVEAIERAYEAWVHGLRPER